MKNKKKQLLNTAYNKAFKFRFYPDSEQISLLDHYFGSARFVYNQTLNHSIHHYASRQHKITDNYGDLLTIKNNDFKSFSSNDRAKHLNELKILYPWLHNVSSIVLQQSLINLNNAYSNFFKKCKNSSIKQKGYPQFKKKNNRNSFKIVGKNSLHFDNNGSFTLPKFEKPLNIKFSRDFDRAKVSSVTVSKEPNGHYFISFLSEDSFKRLPSVNERIAFDSGIKTNITSFNGSINAKGKPSFETFNLPDLKDLISKIKKAQQELSRKVKGSNNRNKSRIKLARLYAKKENKVNDFYHKLSSKIVNDNQVIILEDLNFNSMKENKSLFDNIEEKSKKSNIRKNLQKISLSKIYNYIEYKSKWYGKTLIYADKYYPSSKKCSTLNCDYINNELKLEERTWKCPCCNVVHERDENAALNLYNYSEDNAKIAIKNVLVYHKQKKSLDKDKINKSIIVGNKKPAKIVMNKNLNL